MAEYLFADVEAQARKRWAAQNVYKTADSSEKPKYYVLDMFPYPSGAGLHVGHPLGYIASDIVSRYKRMKGYNVLHPIGFDAFGLPAEQYAIQTGQHPAVTTEQNIKRYVEQMANIGLSYDWDRKVETSDPNYYKWTQWIFLQLFDSWYDKKLEKARPIADLIGYFEKEGNKNVNAQCDENTAVFGANDWKNADELRQSEWLMQYRLAYLAEARVNWCPALGTVLANDEIKDGLSERGGHPVEIRMMRQWMMRISAYSQRLLDGLNEIDWSEAIKEQQRNWIGRSEGALIRFDLVDHPHQIEVFTTRPDTIFGVSFMVLAPEHSLVSEITSTEQRAQVEAYVAKAKNRSERERMADVKTVSGAFTGAYVKHPFTGDNVPVWIADYVLASYGTGAVMAVPGGDERDWRFAKHFQLPILDVIEGSDISSGANDSKNSRIINSGFLNGLEVKSAIKKAIEAIETAGFGKGRIQFRLRDAIFSRQRYWGEPVPIYFEKGIPKGIPIDQLPLRLPAVDKYLPTADGEPPLARAENWTFNGHPLETTTMPGWAGSSWYFLRYMDPHNANSFADRGKIAYWQQVDLYLGGSEHATGHLLYARFWNHFLFDRQLVGFREPFKKLVNQGMIQGVSEYIKASLTITFEKDTVAPLSFQNSQGTVIQPFLPEGGSYQRIYYSAELKLPEFETISRSIDISFVSLNVLNVDALINSNYDQEEFSNAIYFCNEGYIFKGKHFSHQGKPLESNSLRFYTKSEVEKMSKSKRNVVNPDDIIHQYGADTLRLYEMFLGPLEDAKPWDTHGIEGVYRFLNKFWRLFHVDDIFQLQDEAATLAELKILHRTIRKIEDGIERFSFNTCVSAFMICVNELQVLKCRKRSILEPLVKLLSPFAPFLAEHLWEKLGHSESIVYTDFPVCEPQYLEDDTYDYPVQENGKMRFTINLPKQGEKADLEVMALAHEKVVQLLDGKTLKKLVVVPGRIVNLVVN